MASRVEGAEFIFEFPKAPSGYVPSGQSGPHALRWLVVIMSPSSLVAAVLLALAQCLIIGIAGCAIGVVLAASALVKPLAFIFGLLAALVFVPLGLVAVAAASFALPFCLDPIAVAAARVGRCRNVDTVKRAIWIGAVVSVLLYSIGVILLWNWQTTTQPNNVQPWHGYVVVGWLIIVWIGVALGCREQGINFELTPFCEPCGRYMEKRGLGHGPVEGEVVAIERLKDRRLTALHAQLAAQSKPEHSSYLNLQAWACFACAASVVVELETTLVKREQKDDGGFKETRESRRVYSAPLTDHDAAEVPRVFGLTAHPRRSGLQAWWARDAGSRV